MIAVFINNKLISCDSILPIMMEVHQKSGQQIRFYTTDASTFDAIQKNVVLRDGIASIGRLVLLGRRGRGLAGLLGNRLFLAATMLHFLLLIAMGRVHFLHFRALNEFPLNLLARWNRKRTYFCESDSYGENELMLRVAELTAPRQRSVEAPEAGALVAFQPNWSWLSVDVVADLPRYVLGPSRVRKCWVDFVRAGADRYYGSGTPSVDLSRGSIVYMLGFFGALPYMRDKDSTRTLLVETLRILAEAADGRPIFIKPHVISNMAVLEEAMRAAPPANYVITYLHPSVLAVHAKAFVANYYSTTLADGFCLGVPTFEYTDYSEGALAITGGGSMRPDYTAHFINRDADRFASLLRQTLAAPKQTLPVGVTDDKSGFIARLCAMEAAA